MRRLGGRGWCVKRRAVRRHSFNTAAFHHRWMSLSQNEAYWADNDDGVTFSCGKIRPDLSTKLDVRFSRRNGDARCWLGFEVGFEGLLSRCRVEVDINI